MDSFLFIFINIILSVFIQMGVGFFLQKKFNLDIPSLSKVFMYVFIPCILFTKIYEAPLDAKIAGILVSYAIIMCLSLYLISFLLSKVIGLNKSTTGVFMNSVSVYNAGNYCIPLMQLLYSDPYAVSLLVLIIVGQNIISYSFGVYNANKGKSQGREAFKKILKMPMIYSIAVALLLNSFNLNGRNSPILYRWEMYSP